MKLILVLLGWLMLPFMGFTQQHICLQFQSTRDSITFSPVEGVKVGSWYRYMPNYYVSDETGTYCLYLRDSADLKINYLFEHPNVTFPYQSLLEFPYEIRDGKITFFITGVPLPDNHKSIIIYNDPKVKKRTKATVIMRCFPKDKADSMILLDRKNNYLGSFGTKDSTEIQQLLHVNYDDVLFGGSIVNTRSGDTTQFGFNEWLTILPEVHFNPIQRANSEFETICEFYRHTNKMRTFYLNEIDALESKIQRLKDSLTKIQNPERWLALHRGPINYPSAGVIDGVFTRDTIPFSHPKFPLELEEEIVEIIERHEPKRSGVITIELTIDQNGKSHVLPLTNSKDLLVLQKEICDYLIGLDTDVYSISSINYPWVQTFDIGIYPEWR
ncbi:MAG: hypothetical protein NXI10_08180 [bacterium]|nr:hypothetical protein [bacterium]